MFQILFCLLFFSVLWSHQIPLFTPPPTWKGALPKTPSEYVLISFVSEGSAPLRPSINLAVEETDVSLKEYVKAVKEIHLKEPNTKWRDLGKFTMKGGVGRLTEISSRTPHGDTKILQAILIQEKRAYLLTASALKQDYQQVQKEILESLQSLALYSDLLAALPDATKFAPFFASLGTWLPEENPQIAKQKQWERLQKEVVEGCPEMGGHWQFLALQEGLAKINGGPK